MRICPGSGLPWGSIDGRDAILSSMLTSHVPPGTGYFTIGTSDEVVGIEL